MYLLIFTFSFSPHTVSVSVPQKWYLWWFPRMRDWWICASLFKHYTDVPHGDGNKGQHFKTWKASSLLLMELRWMNHPDAEKPRGSLCHLYGLLWLEYNVVVILSLIEMQKYKELLETLHRMLKTFSKMLEEELKRTRVQSAPEDTQTWHRLWWWHPCTQGRGRIWLSLELISTIRQSWRSITRQSLFLASAEEWKERRKEGREWARGVQMVDSYLKTLGRFPPVSLIF